MFAFSVARDLAWTTLHSHRRLPAHPPGERIVAANLVVGVHGEREIVRAALAAQTGKEEHLTLAGPAGYVEGLRIYPEAEMMAWKRWPTRLGRMAFNLDPWTGATAIAEPAPLAEQARRLRERHPGRRHFRIALVNGFGSNLGDTIIGATAWRSAWAVLCQHLPSVTTDVLLGPESGPAAAGLIGHEAGIGTVSFAGPTLEAFSRYDAFLDFTDLVALPRFAQGPHVDWVLWWLGLDPKAVPGGDKRNHLHLPAEAITWAEGRLAQTSGPRVAFVWRASVPLRSIPDDVAVRFAERLLAVAPDITLVTEHPIGLTHPRLLDLGTEADSPERMMALVARCDAVISVDSLAAHVADAADRPCLLLLASLPPERFPYYPNTTIMTPPGVEQLPGWGTTKLSEETFADVRMAYAEAWAALSPDTCWDRLGPLVRPPIPGDRTVRVTERPDPARNPALLCTANPFPYDAAEPLHALIDAEIARISALVLRPGHTALIAVADTGSLLLALTERVAPGGGVHALEPRRLRAQRLGAMALAAGLDGLHLHLALAAETAGRQSIPDFDPMSESDPAFLGNSLTHVPISVIALDDLGLSACALLVLRPPQAITTALAGAERLLREARPLVLAGPMAVAEIMALAEPLARVDYACWAAPVLGGPKGAVLGLAAPCETPITVDGFESVTPNSDLDPS